MNFQISLAVFIPNTPRKRAVSYTNSEAQRIVSGMEVAFLINKTSDLPQETFTLMKDTVQKFIEEHGDEQTKYQIIIHDKKPKKRYHDEARSGLRSFGEPGSYATDRRPKSQSRDSQPEPKPKEVRAKDVKDLQNGDAVFPALHRNLKMADEYFFAETRESSVGKVRAQNLG